MLKPFLLRARFFAALLLIFLCGNASAQRLLSVTGVTFQGASQHRVSGVTVGNFNKRTISTSNEFGVFKIEAAVGDTLIFSKTQYTSQTLIVLNDNMLSIYMQPIVTLEEVTINDMNTRQELAATMNNYMKKTPYGTLRPGAAAYIFSPISGLQNLFGKTAKNARRFEAFSKREMEDVEIEKKYNRDIVKKIVPAISDEDLDAFMVLFKPSYDQVKAWAEYDVIKYVQNSYDYYSKNKEKLKPQKLY